MDGAGPQVGQGQVATSRNDSVNWLVALGLLFLWQCWMTLTLFAPGAFTGYTFDGLGLRATAKTFTLAAASRAHTDRRTVMNGVPYVHVTDGVWAGRWVPTQPRLTLR